MAQKNLSASAIASLIAGRPVLLYSTRDPLLANATFSTPSAGAVDSPASTDWIARANGASLIARLRYFAYSAAAGHANGINIDQSNDGGATTMLSTPVLDNAGNSTPGAGVPALGYFDLSGAAFRMTWRMGAGNSNLLMDVYAEPFAPQVVETTTLPPVGAVHVRKTIVLNASAGRGAVGVITPFALTGRVALTSLFIYGTGIVSAGHGIMAGVGITTDAQAIIAASAVSGDVDGITGFIFPGGATGSQGSSPNLINYGGGSWVNAASGSIGIDAPPTLTVSGAAWQTGTLIIDCTYELLTANGALVGD